MKKITLILVIIFNTSIVFSQDFEKLESYDFTSEESFKLSEGEILETANYLLNNPVDKDEKSRAIAILYIMKWMEGTPDYTFSIDSKVVDLTTGSPHLLALFLAAMTKTVLENEGSELTEEQIFTSAQDLLVEYCSEKDNNLKPSKTIKKIIRKSR